MSSAKRIKKISSETVDAWRAIEARDSEALALAMKRGANPSGCVWATLLGRACQLEAWEQAEMLIGLGVDPELRAPDLLDTAMMSAARAGKLGAMIWLESLGARLLAPMNERGQNALSAAAVGAPAHGYEGARACLEHLASRGADLEQAGSGGPPLLAASLWSNVAAVESLIGLGARVDAKIGAKAHEKYNPSLSPELGALHLAVHDGNAEGYKCARALIKAGVDVELRAGGHSALDLACRKIRPEALSLLTESGAVFSSAQAGREALLSYGKRPECRAPKPGTSSVGHRMAFESIQACMGILIRSGVDCSSPEADGSSFFERMGREACMPPAFELVAMAHGARRLEGFDQGLDMIRQLPGSLHEEVERVRSSVGSSRRRRAEALSIAKAIGPQSARAKTGHVEPRGGQAARL